MGIRGLVPILYGVLAACSGGEAPVGTQPEAARPAPVATVTSDAARSAGAFAGGAVLSPEALELAPAGPAPAAEAALSGASPLPPALAEVLEAGRSGLALDPRDDLAIAFEEQPGDHLPLVLSGTSVVDEGSLPPAALGPVPAAPEEGLH